MKKTLIILLLGVGVLGCLCAQSVTPDAIVPEGAVSEINDISLEWTLGEVFVHTVNHEVGILTQGSQQPMLLIDLMHTGEKESIYKGIAIQVFPNPVEAVLNIYLESTEEKELDIALLDVSGKSLKQMTGAAAADQLELDMKDFTAGMYFLRFTDKKGRLVKAFKISKIRD